MGEALPISLPDLPGHRLGLLQLLAAGCRCQQLEDLLLHSGHIGRGVAPPGHHPPHLDPARCQKPEVAVVGPASVRQGQKDDPVVVLLLRENAGLLLHRQLEFLRLPGVSGSPDPEAVYDAVQDLQAHLLGQLLDLHEKLPGDGGDPLVHLYLAELGVAVSGVAEAGDQHPLQYGILSGVRGVNLLPPLHLYAQL